MTLEIAITETIDVTDIMSQVLWFVKKLFAKIIKEDQDEDVPDVDVNDENKAPPVDQKPTDDSSKPETPSDLSISVSDNSSAGEAFGP